MTATVHDKRKRGRGNKGKNTDASRASEPAQPVIFPERPCPPISLLPNENVWTFAKKERPCGLREPVARVVIVPVGDHRPRVLLVLQALRCRLVLEPLHHVLLLPRFRRGQGLGRKGRGEGWRGRRAFREGECSVHRHFASPCPFLGCRSVRGQDTDTMAEYFS